MSIFDESLWIKKYKQHYDKNHEYLSENKIQLLEEMGIIWRFIRMHIKPNRINFRWGQQMLTNSLENSRDNTLIKTFKTKTINSSSNIIKHLFFFFAISLLFTLSICLFKVDMCDTSVHISRIYNLAQSFKNGNWDPYIYESCYLNLGYPFGIFYPDTFLKPFAFLVYLGLNEYYAYGLMIFVLNFATFLNIYFMMTKINKESAFIISVYYFLYPYRIYDLVFRAALGELLFFCMFPFLLYGLYKMFYKKEFSWFLGFGILAILNSHILSTLLTLCFLVIFYAINIKTLLSNRKIISWTLINAVFVFFCSLKIIIPILETQLTEQLVYNTNPAFFGTITSHAIQICSSELKSLLIIAFISIILLTFYLFKKTAHKGFLYFGIIIVLIFATTNLFPWQLVENICPFVSIIQFPFRILEFAIIPYIGIFCYTKIPKRIQKQIAVFSCVVLLIISSFWHSISEPHYSKETMICAGIGQCDYLNTEFDKLISEYNWSAFYAMLSIDEDLSIDLDDAINLEIINGYIPKIYYKNYKIQDSKNISYEYVNKNGLIFIPNLADKNIEISISYQPTIYQKCSVFISNFTYILFLCLYLTKCQKKQY